MYVYGNKKIRPNRHRFDDVDSVIFIAIYSTAVAATVGFGEARQRFLKRVSQSTIESLG